MFTKTRKEKRKTVPQTSASFAIREEAFGVTYWIIPECDCYYYIEAYIVYWSWNRVRSV
jgi:hypothetical protein